MDFADLDSPAITQHSSAADELQNQGAPKLLFQIASDLHIEFFNEESSNWDEVKMIKCSGEASTLALLGDIGVLTTAGLRRQYFSFVEWCTSKFRHVIIITGNHEYYNHQKPRVGMAEVDGFLSSFTAEHNATVRAGQSQLGEVHFLNNSSIEIDGVVFLGTTLWSRMPNMEAIYVVEQYLNDYRLITSATTNRTISAKETGKIFEKNLQWLQDELTSISLLFPDKPVVVLTHHTPSTTGTSDPMYENVALPEGYSNCAFSSDLREFILNPLYQRQLKCWCYGHTHFNNRQQIGEVLLISNQRGYVMDPTDGYDSARTLCVDISACTVVN